MTAPALATMTPSSLPSETSSAAPDASSASNPKVVVGIEGVEAFLRERRAYHEAADRLERRLGDSPGEPARLLKLREEYTKARNLGKEIASAWLATNSAEIAQLKGEHASELRLYNDACKHAWNELRAVHPDMPEQFLLVDPNDPHGSFEALSVGLVGTEGYEVPKVSIKLTARKIWEYVNSYKGSSLAGLTEMLEKSAIRFERKLAESSPCPDRVLCNDICEAVSRFWFNKNRGPYAAEVTRLIGRRKENVMDCLTWLVARGELETKPQGKRVQYLPAGEDKVEL